MHLCSRIYKCWACIDARPNKILTIYRPGRVFGHIMERQVWIHGETVITVSLSAKNDTRQSHQHLLFSSSKFSQCCGSLDSETYITANMRFLENITSMVSSRSNCSFNSYHHCQICVYRKTNHISRMQFIERRRCSITKCVQ